MVTTMVAHMILDEVHSYPMVEVVTPTQYLLVDLVIGTP
jgi:hypothetical protein